MPAVHAEESLIRRDWRFFILLTFLFNFGFSVYSGVFQNFLRDVLHAGPQQLGNMESLREIPGLLTALMAGTLVALAESRVAALGLFITAIGISLSGFMGSFWPLVGITVFWSIGFHLYSTVTPAITLTLAKGLEGGKHLGRMNSVGSTATLVALAVSTVAAAVWKGLPYWAYFVFAGVSIVLGSALCGRLSRHAEGAPRARLIVRREYGLYYLLIFLEGCRRQIFSIFASFALILVYGVPLEKMLVLQFVNAILISITAPAMGRYIDRHGERRPLSIYSIGLILVFFGYASVHNVYGLYALFLIDNVLFSFNVGFTTYLHRIVRPGELTPCLAMGTTMNHIAAVTVPCLGAWLWRHFDNYQIPFWVGVAIAFVALIANQWLPKESSQPAPPEEQFAGDVKEDEVLQMTERV